MSNPMLFSLRVCTLVIAVVGPLTEAQAQFALSPSPNAPGSAVTRLFDVHVLAPNDIWAVGMHRDVSVTPTEQFSLAMHFDGSSWSIVPTPSPMSPAGLITVELHDVSALSPNHAYAAGSYLGNSNISPDTFVVRWDGTQWTHLPTPGQSQFGAQGFLFEAVEAIDAQNVWFGGQWAATPPRASMVRYDGSGFTTFLLPLAPGSNGAYRIRAISSLSTDDIWAVGATGGTAPAIGSSYVAHWNGSTWSHVPTPHFGFGENLRDVIALATDDVWVSGKYDDIVGGVPTATPLFLHWDGAAWTPHFGAGFAQDLAALGPQNILGVDGHRLVHWDGFSWDVVDQIAPGGPPTVMGIDVLGQCEFLTVGFNSLSVLSSTSLIAEYHCPFPATTVSLGGGCNSSGGSNSLTSNQPWAGSVWQATGTGLPSMALVAFVNGFSQIATPLANILPQGVPGCSLLASPDFVALVVASGGLAQGQMPLPNTPSLAGVVFYSQMVPLELDAQLNLATMTSTNVLELTIGAF